jgi:hypothetical protein
MKSQRCRFSKQQQTTLLLNYLDFPKADVSQTIAIMSSFKTSPICVHLGSLFTEFSKLPERDWEYELTKKDQEISELKKQIDTLQQREDKNIKQKEKELEIEKQKQKELEKEIQNQKQKQKQKELEIELENNKTIKPQDFESDIFEACINGKLSSVIYLISHGTSIESKDNGIFHIHHDNFFFIFVS